MEIFYGGYCRESDAPHSYGVNDLRSHTLLCPSLASTVFFFCLSHLHFIPSRLGSYKVVPILYRDVSVFAGHVFPLRPHGHNVSWFPDVDPRNGKPPARMCWPSPLDVLLFQNFHATDPLKCFNIPKQYKIYKLERRADVAQQGGCK